MQRQEILRLLETMRKLVQKGTEIISILERLIELDGSNQLNGGFDIFIKPGTMCQYCINWDKGMCSVIARGCDFNPLI